MPKTAEERKAYNKAYFKAYRIKNAEKLKAQKKVWNKENAEKIKAYDKLYRQENIERYKKTDAIYNWKRSGLICDDYDKLYELYLQSTHCEECGCKYSIWGDGVGRFRCMDHCHLTGVFRNFICSKCNLHRG